MRLYAASGLTPKSSARLLANGAGGVARAGGLLLIEGASVSIEAGAAISARGGDGKTSNGGTIKLLYGTLVGTKPAASMAGRVVDAGAGSAQ